jgi:hypothetical protein
MTLPGQASAATASYGSEGQKIASSQQTLNQIVASFKKLTALVPVSNDMMRYADPAVDAFVRDDLVKVIALPRTWPSSSATAPRTPRAASCPSPTATPPPTADGGRLLDHGQLDRGGRAATSSPRLAYTLATVAAELGGAVNKLDTANVPDFKRVWFMHPRSYNYLYNVQNSLGVYVYRDELNKGTLLSYPFKKTTQIGVELPQRRQQSDCSFVFLVEMNEDMILDSMSLELAVSREGTYVDGNGTTGLGLPERPDHHPRHRRARSPAPPRRGGRGDPVRALGPGHRLTARGALAGPPLPLFIAL